MGPLRFFEQNIQKGKKGQIDFKYPRPCLINYVIVMRLLFASSFHRSSHYILTIRLVRRVVVKQFTISAITIPSVGVCYFLN